MKNIPLTYMTEDWIKRYFTDDQIPEVLEILSLYGTEAWHRERDRVIRDALIISGGSIDALRATIALAMEDYRDVLVSEEVDQRVIEEIKKYGPNTLY